MVFRRRFQVRRIRKLTDGQVKEILDRLKSKNPPRQRVLADKMGVSHQLISKIARKKVRTHKHPPHKNQRLDKGQK